MTAAKLLARGPPTHVSASAFYDTADGAAARARLGSATAIPKETTSSSTRPYARQVLHSRTMAPLTGSESSGNFRDVIRTRAARD
jgi:hypothetical protein